MPRGKTARPRAFHPLFSAIERLLPSTVDGSFQVTRFDVLISDGTHIFLDADANVLKATWPDGESATLPCAFDSPHRLGLTTALLEICVQQFFQNLGDRVRAKPQPGDDATGSESTATSQKDSSK
jgi:hypothetical protein